MPRRIGYAPGVFDMFHIGHLNLLRRAASHCDHLVAGVLSDEMAMQAKGRVPVIPLGERIEIVRNMVFVDEVWPENVTSKVATWREVKFDLLFKGDDWRGTTKGDRLVADMGKVGVEVVFLPYTAHTSSTMLRGVLESRTLSKNALSNGTKTTVSPSE
ncbi:adenylyltransferase/cytidyltransferase family protein [Amycolatopsis sp. GM8]|uniref:adenylyltransferase/cytidyltransferase family protein n=1 Tax=Amycolatopsis sp. GM8 TaxID=2896530 RepID=UPI001F01553B|nr:adenylyltransferase/cytidyltransferase family protein [Amycolatopsis sp. GM8]